MREGFTLIEMLVALAVFALAAMALVKLSVESTRTAAYMEQRALAGMVAETVAAELSLGLMHDAGGTRQLAGRDWNWVALSMPVEGRVEGIEVQVLADGQIAARRRVARVVPS